MDSGDSSRQTTQKEDQPVPKVAKEGFTTLASGGQNPSLDIVLIHGIQGHPKDTWTFENSNEPEKGFLPFFKKKNKSSANSNRNFWPRDDLPRDLPESRVLTYGYDSHVTKFCGAELNLNTITDHAESFLNSLVRERKDCPTRPLLFLVHSLGGLILKSVSILFLFFSPRDLIMGTTLGPHAIRNRRARRSPQYQSCHVRHHLFWDSASWFRLRQYRSSSG